MPIFTFSPLSKHALFQKCNHLNGCCLLHSRIAPPECRSPANSTLSCLFKQILHCKRSQTQQKYLGTLSGYGHWHKGSTRFPYKRQRMLIKAQGFSGTIERVFLFFFKTWTMKNLKSDLMKRDSAEPDKWFLDKGIKIPRFAKHRLL